MSTAIVMHKKKGTFMKKGDKHRDSVYLLTWFSCVTLLLSHVEIFMKIHGLSVYLPLHR